MSHLRRWHVRHIAVTVPHSGTSVPKEHTNKIKSKTESVKNVFCVHGLRYSGFRPSVIILLIHLFRRLLTGSDESGCDCVAGKLSATAQTAWQASCLRLRRLLWVRGWQVVCDCADCCEYVAGKLSATAQTALSARSSVVSFIKRGWILS